MSEHSVRNFYDELAHDYHLMFRDWDASMAYQAEVLGGIPAHLSARDRTLSWTARAGWAPRPSGWPWPGTRS